jgi:hypothetical protein
LRNPGFGTQLHYQQIQYIKQRRPDLPLALRRLLQHLRTGGWVSWLDLYLHFGSIKYAIIL